MDLLRSVERNARIALANLRDKAAQDAWDQERLEREKGLFIMGHEVTLCSEAGCLELATAVPGFDHLDLKCPAHEAADQGAQGEG